MPLDYFSLGAYLSLRFLFENKKATHSRDLAIWTIELQSRKNLGL